MGGSADDELESRGVLDGSVDSTAKLQAIARTMRKEEEEEEEEDMDVGEGSADNGGEADPGMVKKLNVASILKEAADEVADQKTQIKPSRPSAGRSRKARGRGQRSEKSKTLVDVANETLKSQTPDMSSQRENDIAVPIDSVDDAKLLLAAAFHGDVREARRLCEERANRNAFCVDGHGWTPLHWACSKGHKSFVAYLLDKCNHPLQVTSELNGWTPLHLAAINSRYEVAEMLLERGASKEVFDKWGDIPFDTVPRPTRRSADIEKAMAKFKALRKLLQPFIAKKGEAGDGEGEEEYGDESSSGGETDDEKGTTPRARSGKRAHLKGSSEDFGE